MTLTSIGKLAAMLWLAGALAGCVNAEVDIAITSRTTAKATMTQVLGADLYTLVKLNAAEAEAAAAKADAAEAEDTDATVAKTPQFCAEGDLTENADGSATCVIVESGPFARLGASQQGPKLVFAAAGPGLVRISLATAALKTALGAGDAMDAETEAMMGAFFKNRTLTLRFSGAAVTETNMTPADDGLSAEIVIPLLDFMQDTAELPGTLFAVVQVP